MKRIQIIYGENAKDLKERIDKWIANDKPDIKN